MVNYLVRDHFKSENLLLKQSLCYFPFFGMTENNIRHFCKLSCRRNNLNIVKGHNAIWKILSKLKMSWLVHLQNIVLEIQHPFGFLVWEVIVSCVGIQLCLTLPDAC